MRRSIGSVRRDPNPATTDPAPAAIAEPRSGATSLTELRRARDTGRLVDPEGIGFRPQLRFERRATRASFSREWWNGLLYSRWQLIALHDVRSLLHQGKWSRRDGQIRWRSPPLAEWAPRRVQDFRRLAAVLVALEARYLPTLEEQRIHLTNASVEEWEAFIKHFDALDLLGRLGWNPDDLLRAADKLLIGIARVDPFAGDWSELVRRAPRRTWDKLSGDALAAKTAVSRPRSCSAATRTSLAAAAFFLSPTGRIVSTASESGSATAPSHWTRTCQVSVSHHTPASCSSWRARPRRSWFRGFAIASASRTEPK
jgi:hypothetical protein